MDSTLSTAAILAAVALSEGIRATPPGALVVHRVLGGPWTPVEPLALGRGFTLPSVSPFSVAVMVPPVQSDHDARALVEVLRTRMTRVRVLVTTLRMLGALSFTMLVIGVPFMTLRIGWFGLALALAALLILAFVQAVVVFRGIRVVDAGRSPLAVAIRVLWPFTTARSAELVLETVVAGMPPLVAARALMSDDDFHGAVRPLAYDVVNGRHVADPATLRALCDVAELRAIVERPPGDGGRFCPRCAAGYAPGVRECAECEAVPLVDA